MKGYLSIGAVSKRKNVSIKSLRYYDRIGVFRPAYVNESTNYRYYTEDQLYVLDAISLCVELGIPLHDFEKYVDDDGIFNLQGLLYDGKLLAEQKISDIRDRLGAVQAALRALDADSLNVNNIVKKNVEPEIPFRDTFTQKQLDKQYILTSPYAEDPEQNDSQQILRLFMLAQLLGMTGSYPSGIIYDYDEAGEVVRTLYIHVDDPGESQDKRLRLLPEGNYYCITGEGTPIADHGRIREEFFEAGTPCTIIERDVVKEEDSEEHGRELLFLN